MIYKNRIIQFPQNRVWRNYLGGRTLDRLIGKDDPRDSHFPEDWIGSVTPARNPDSNCENEGISKVRIDDQEELFADLIARDPDYFLGKDHVTRFGQQPMVLVAQSGRLWPRYQASGKTRIRRFGGLGTARRNAAERALLYGN